MKRRKGRKGKGKVKGEEKKGRNTRKRKRKEKREEKRSVLKLQGHRRGGREVRGGRKVVRKRGRKE